MAKIGIFYGSSTGHTEKVAVLLAQAFGNDAITLDVADASKTDLDKFPYLIFGTSTWDIGGMQDDWEDFMEMVQQTDLRNKKIALFGLGDQENFPDSFADGIGVLYNQIADKSKVVGAWPTEGYEFDESEAVKDGKFVGLVIDEDNQSKLTDERVKKWVEMLKKEFK
ncbi:MAG: flavodoxin FldA [Bacteroidales bacterium]|nr:flavodoxin FldA [Bacteroidales bacterium]